MGVVNVTPDSFSDGGKFFEHEAAIDHGLSLAADEADVLDVGGESTRPHATPVDPVEQLRRVMPVVRALCERTTVPVSIDTRTARVAREAIAAGAEIINDVTGLTNDPEMLRVALDSAAGLCVMHMLGTPQTMQDNPTYDDVVEEIFDYLKERRDTLVEAGVDQSRICLDPGIGFGKTYQHNLTLMAQSGRYHDLGCPLLVGHSRKRFLGELLGTDRTEAVKKLGQAPSTNRSSLPLPDMGREPVPFFHDRTAATIGAAMTLARQGIQIIRVHDVAPVRDALHAFEATGGMDGPSGGRLGTA